MIGNAGSYLAVAGKSSDPDESPQAPVPALGLVRLRVRVLGAAGNYTRLSRAGNESDEVRRAIA